MTLPNCSFLGLLLTAIGLMLMVDSLTTRERCTCPPASIDLSPMSSEPIALAASSTGCLRWEKKDCNTTVTMKSSKHAQAIRVNIDGFNPDHSDWLELATFRDEKFQLVYRHIVGVSQ